MKSFFILIFALAGLTSTDAASSEKFSRNTMYYYKALEVDTLPKADKEKSKLFTEKTKALDFLVPAINAGLLAAGISMVVLGVGQEDSLVGSGILTIFGSCFFAGITSLFYNSRKKSNPKWIGIAQIFFTLMLVGIGIFVLHGL